MCGRPSNSHHDHNWHHHYDGDNDGAGGGDVTKPQHPEPQRRLSPAARAAERAIVFYRKKISPLKGSGSCRFEPTCSAYGLTAVRRYGAGKGLWLAFLRIMRCAPWHPGGWDPVPQHYPGLASWWKRMHR